MKVLIEIDEHTYEQIRSHNLYDFDTISEDLAEDVANVISEGIALNGTNGEVLMKMFPPSVYFPSDGTYMVLLTKDCLVSCSNMDWWNAPYKGEEQE